MSSTLETLPDEILMIIFKYSGDIHTIFQAFVGLNQRLNRILTDKRLHLLTDFLSINTKHVSIDDYYNSVVFHEVSHQLLCTNGIVNEDQLRQYFQKLISFHLRKQYMHSENEFQSNLATFKALRQQLTDDEIKNVDTELNQLFSNLQRYPVNINDIKRIEFLVFKRGGRLQCDDLVLDSFNLATAINQLLHSHLNDMNFTNKQIFRLKTRMFKALIISNPNLLTNEDLYIYSRYTVWFFLFYSIYHAEYFPYSSRVVPVNMECYKAVVNLLFFAIQCQRLQFNIADWTQENLFYILNMIPTLEKVNRNGMFIEIVQWEVLKIITDIYISTGTTSWHDNISDEFKSILRKLINKNRVDVIIFIYRRLEHVRYFYNQSSNCRIIVDMMTGGQIGRQLLKTFMDEKSLETWITGKDFIFILLQKKERKLLEKLLRLSPFLIHQLDENGNDPLLYICLKVCGCRHRIVELLIAMKSNLQRKNFDDINVFDAIRLEQNRKLLEKLNIKEINEINKQRMIRETSKLLKKMK